MDLKLGPSALTIHFGTDLKPSALAIHFGMDLKLGPSALAIRFGMDARAFGPLTAGLRPVVWGPSAPKPPRLKFRPFVTLDKMVKKFQKKYFHLQLDKGFRLI